MGFEFNEKKQEIPNSLKEKYFSQTDTEGFLPISSFSTKELKRQTKSIAAFLDGDEGSNPDANLGENLNFKGSSGNYSEVKIHIDDLDEFIKRVKDYYGE